MSTVGLTSLRLAAFSVISLASAICRLPAPETITQDELVGRTQELYHAIPSGNQEPWRKYYADDCVFADEKGRQFDKAKLIADILPLPKAMPAQLKS